MTEAELLALTVQLAKQTAAARAEHARAIPLADSELLRRAIAASGLSARRFALEVMGRNDRSVRRWLADEPMPVVVHDWLTRYLERG